MRMGILVAILIGSVLAGMILALTGSRRDRQPYNFRRLFAPDYTAFNRFNPVVPGPQRAMENLKQEMKETRSRVVRASHRSRPR